MKKLLIIPFLLFPSISYAETMKSDWAEKTRQNCKNWGHLEKVPQEEAIKCLTTIITHLSEQTQANKINIERLHDAFQN